MEKEKSIKEMRGGELIAALQKRALETSDLSQILELRKADTSGEFLESVGASEFKHPAEYLKSRDLDPYLFVESVIAAIATSETVIETIEKIQRLHLPNMDYKQALAAFVTIRTVPNEMVENAPKLCSEYEKYAALKLESEKSDSSPSFSKKEGTDNYIW